MTGRDWHKDDGLPCCYTWVGCEGELTVPKLLDAIRGGHICLSAGPLLTMEAEVPGENGSGKEAFPAEKHSGGHEGTYAASETFRKRYFPASGTVPR